MRVARLKFPKDTPRGIYHLHSRVVDGRKRFQARECEHLVRVMRKHEKFCQVQVLAFSILPDHFHMLVAVDAAPATPWDDDRLLRHLQECQHPRFVATQEQLKALRKRGLHQAADQLKESFLKRMWEVSPFMKGFKQEVTQWYNSENGRNGTLWECRFRSAMIEGPSEMLRLIASRIEFNGVRCGMTQDPQTYRWCSYAQAMAGNRLALEGIAALLEVTPEEALASYRRLLYAWADGEGLGQSGKTPRLGKVSQKRIETVLNNKGVLTLAECLACPARYFVQGAVLGSRAFVEDFFLKNRGKFGPKRRHGAHPIEALGPGDYFALRRLRVRPFG